MISLSLLGHVKIEAFKHLRQRKPRPSSATIPPEDHRLLSELKSSEEVDELTATYIVRCVLSFTFSVALIPPSFFQLAGGRESGGWLVSESSISEKFCKSRTRKNEVSLYAN